jgi:phosphoenolpyruvate carboxykinase (ATP)
VSGGNGSVDETILDRLNRLGDLARLELNTSRAGLVQHAVRRKEGELTADGAFSVCTGAHTGRSAADKFVVRDEVSEKAIWWDNARPLSRQHFDDLLDDFLAHAAGRDLFVQDLYAGAHQDHRLPVRVCCEFAWHALFIQHLLIEPTDAERETFAPGLTIIDLPAFRADPLRHGVSSQTVIAVDFTRRLVLIGGTSYAGEIKKSVFTYLNYELPKHDILPMHCSANVGDQGDVAIFFGLSGTGKTTLSTEPTRALIGDDEHGWSSDGIYNFEGGCYAKVIRLDREREPQIHAATNRWSSVLENVVLDPRTRQPQFDDGGFTENTRSAYPIEFIDNADASGCAGHPRNVIMLTADAFGVLPPIARLSPEQAMYHFLAGYTAKVAGTEKGVIEPEATFSTCFGAPFMPRHPSVYGEMLRARLEKHGVSCWLLNTGWTGGAYGTGERMPLAATRALLRAALSGALDAVPMRRDPTFGFMVPLEVTGIDARLLDPRATWSDPAAYDAQAARLAGMFARNFLRFEGGVDAEICAAGPVFRAAAE